MAYYLQANPGLLIVLVRHGRTKLNSASNTIVRGWKDEPLMDSKRGEIIDTARELKQYDPKWVVSSDFMRDSQTAQILASDLQLSDTGVDYDARTWDVGQFSGQPESQVNDAIHDLYLRPWEVPPGSGESFNDFAARWTKFLDRQMSMATIEVMRPGIIVTHGRNIALTDAQYNFKTTSEGLMPLPAGYALLTVANDRSVQFNIPGESECVCVDI